MGMNEKLKAYMQVMQVLNKNTSDALYLFDLVNDRIYFARDISEKYPIEIEEDGGVSLSSWKKIVYSRDLKQLEQELLEILKGQSDVHDIEYRILNREGETIWIKCRGTVYRDESSQLLFLCGAISKLAVSHKVDNLTGLRNYDKFMEDMSEYLQTEEGYLMVFGIDNFKHINMKKGRSFGNHILKQASDILESCAEYPLKPYRLTGDCFAVNFPWKTRDEVLKFYNHLQQELERYCTISAGVAEYRRGSGLDAGSVYQYAENALDRAKREGKNILVFFSSEDYQKNLDRIELLNEIKGDIQENCKGFFLCYQPQIDSLDFSLYGAEALLRYKSRTRGNVGPLDFIPLLEQSGLICTVGLWVLKTAVNQCAKWRKVLPNLHINVNISYVQLRQEGITEAVLEILEKAQLPGEALTLEVTESIQLQDYPYFNRIFYEWKRCGIQIAIDDFGTGYSSLSYLKSIDVDETKIDRCFVSRIQMNAYHYRLLENMIELAHSAQIRVCCEGVETEEELRALKELNADVFQGFLFAKPCLPEEFERRYIFPETEEYQTRIKQEESLQKLEALDSLEQGGDRELFRDVLEHTQLGLWKICIDLETGENEMYADPVMLHVLGVEKELTPKECYEFWYSRINDGYYQYVNLAVEASIKERKLIQVEYTWNHPIQGEVTVRCMTVRAKDLNGKICLEGYHRIISNLERMDFLPEGRQSEMFEYNEKKQAIYFHTKRKLLAGIGLKEKNFPQCWVKSQMVHPHFAGEFCELFQQVQNKKNVDGREMMFRAASGSYEWFKIKTIHLSEKEEDANTIAVLMEPAGQNRSLELAYMRKNDFYMALLSETVAHAEVDVESGHIMQASGFWKAYGIKSREKGLDFDQAIQSQIDTVVCKEDRAQYRKYLNLQYMKNMCEEGISTKEFCFRRLVDGQYCWMELVLHVFQEHYTKNMYALMYLKNIDVEKRRELAQESAAKRDPLTNVFNRSVFEEEVVAYMKEAGREARGAMIILDLDNFKKVNDKFGHLKGDEMLKGLTEILQHTFRNQDVIGRLGGDEFLVFVKGIADKEILDRRLKELFINLNNAENVPLSCSAGISMVKGDHFQYEEALKQADMALYKSKEDGKQCYRYYDE